MFEVYLTTNNINGKVYVGQTVDYRYKGYLGSGRSITSAIKKYGKENFTKVVLRRCETPEETDFYERFFIKMFNSQDRSIGYNLAEGGKVNRGHTSWRLGLKADANWCQNISDGLKGKPKSKEHIQKLNAGKIAKYGNSSPAKGSKRSPEQSQRQSQRQLGKKCAPCSEERKRKIGEAQLGEKNHNYINVDLAQLKELRLAGNTYKEIAEKLGISIWTVRDRLNKTF